jgi:AcrR family transcriptional regulator
MARRRRDDAAAPARAADPGAGAADAREGHDAGAARRDAILDAAKAVFLRYGFKKTSMDDLARAAALSRQGLYLHFQTKEALFKAALERLLAQVAAAGHEALACEDRDLEDRLLTAFEAFHGSAVETAAHGHMDELLEAATSLVGALFDGMEREFTGAIAAVLSRAGLAAAWRSAGVSAKDLADHLYAASAGIKHAVTTLAAYRARMRIAVKIVVRGAPR